MNAVRSYVMQPHGHSKRRVPLIVPGMFVVGILFLLLRRPWYFYAITIAVVMVLWLVHTVTHIDIDQKLPEVVARVIGFVSAIVVLAISILTIVVPWVFERVLFAKKWTGRESWQVPKQTRGHNVDEKFARMWARGARIETHLVHRGKRLIALLASSAVVAATLFGGTRAAQETDLVPAQIAGTPGEVAEVKDVELPFAMEGSEWYSQYVADNQFITADASAQSLLAPRRIEDVITKTLTVEDLRRHSWEPPACDCPTYTVWIYGGSTTFGVDQRDEFTIASYLSKIAFDNGIALNIVNNGVIGDSHFEELTRFSQDLATHEAPDAVIFYSGVNEIIGSHEGLTYRRFPAAVNISTWREYRELDPPDSNVRSRGEFRQYPGPNLTSADDAASVIMDNYARSLEVSRALAEFHDVPALHFWQPSVFERNPAVPGEGNSNDGIEYAIERGEAMVERIPRGVIDISDVFNSVEGPIYVDDVHTNERGAEIVADEIYPFVVELLDENG